MLQYDNSAFYFFALSFVTVYVVPSWISIINQVCTTLFARDKHIGAVARTNAETKKVEELKRQARSFGKLTNSNSFLINLGTTTVLTGIFLWLVNTISTMERDVNAFDPFHILGIDSGANVKVIKRKYFDLAQIWHPDKNKGDRAAEAKFILIKKAYDTLTDEQARQNWEDCGNPDCNQPSEFGIGLPDLFLESDNRNLILMMYLVIIVFVIPFSAWRYYSESSKFGERDVMYDTYTWYHHTLNENILVKSLPEVMAGSAEFRQLNMPKTSQDKQDIRGIITQIKNQMQKPKYNHPAVVEGNVLLHTHLLRKTNHDLLIKTKNNNNPNILIDNNLRSMLETSTSLIDAMINVCKSQDGCFQTAQRCIEFGQYVTQAMWNKDSNLLQIPHFTKETIRHCCKDVKNGNKTLDIVEYRNLISDNDPNKKNKNHHRQIMSSLFNEDQVKDIDTFLNQFFPNISIETNVFVDDDDDGQVYEGDLCTVRVTITRNNNNNSSHDDDTSSQLVHAPYFPFPKSEAWWIGLGTKDGKIISLEKKIVVGSNSNSNSNILEHDIKFLAPNVGEYEFDLIVKSNGYVGLDQQQSILLTTLDNSTLPEYKIHPDDKDLDDTPTLFEEMMSGNIIDDDDDYDDSDSDDDDDDDAAESITNKLSDLKMKKKQQAKNARHEQHANDDEDDDDDDSDIDDE